MGAHKNGDKERAWTFYVEMFFVGLGVAAVLAWLAALVYVIVT